MTVSDLIPLLPLIESLVQFWQTQGKDPAAELRAMLEASDAATDEIEKRKFGGK